LWADLISFQSRLYGGLPFYILGVVGILASGVSIYLPETANEKLADTVEEAEQFGRDQPFFGIAFLERRKKEKRRRNTEKKEVEWSKGKYFQVQINV
jgi:hypothetical protein